jgi:hypothetical protein
MEFYEHSVYCFGSPAEAEMRPFDRLRRFARNSDKSTQLIEEIREGVSNQSSLLNDKLEALIEAIVNQSRTLDTRLGQLNREAERQSLLMETLSEKLEAIIQGIANQANLQNTKFNSVIEILDTQTTIAKAKM